MAAAIFTAPEWAFPPGAQLEGFIRMSKNTPVTVAYGDGIGPEIMEATLKILKAAGARLDIETVEIGEKVYLRGNSAGIEPGAFDSLRRTKVFLKAPITTPQGGGYKSLNVTTRKTFGLYANVRPCVSYYPFVETKHPIMDIVIVRENEEDLYAGIEHRQTDEVYQTLKLISRPGSEKIVRYAFEYARANARKKVTCFTKDNIMKMTDGLFHKVFEEIGEAYPDIEKEHWIVDIGAAKMATSPENFDVIVLPNLYGDILSDVAAMMTGSVGLAGSANIGSGCAMFEAIHGSAPRHAGQDKANPSGLLLGAVMMLVHIGQGDIAEKIHNGWLRTIEEGIHTYDIYTDGLSTKKAGTREFTDAVIERLDQMPQTLKAASYKNAPAQNLSSASIEKRPRAKKELTGVDVFVDWVGEKPADLAGMLAETGGSAFELKMISNRGQEVWPVTGIESMLTDHWRCRYLGKSGALPGTAIIELLKRISDAGVECIKTENLYNFDGKPGYSGAQG
jgi:isocitrate dehydrogenase